MAGDLRLRTSEVRYARTPGADVAYRIVDGGGQGTRDVVLANGGTMPMDALFEDPVASRFVEGLAGLGRLVLFDRCGIGLSDPPPDPDVSGLTRWVDDIGAVIDAAAVTRPLMVGIRLGGDAVIVWSAAHPADASSAVLFEPARGLRMDREQLRGQLDGEVDSVALWIPSRADEPGFREWFNDAGRRGASPRLAAEAYGRITTDDLRAIEDATMRLALPTLLLRRPAHPYSPSRADDPVLAQSTSVERVDLPGPDLSPFGDEVDTLLSEITRFVTGEHQPPAPDRELVAVLYTDLVSSTARASDVGDARWKRVLDRHDDISRASVARRGGTVIKTTGDGILATLPSVTGALAAAHDIRAGLAGVGLEVRAAIHVGDVDRRGDDIAGINVVIAARILALAEPGDVLLSSSALPALGTAVAVTSRGAHELKGVRGTWVVYAVDPA